MKTFILFIFGVFEDQEDIEYFCLDIFGSSDKISKVRYVIEKSQNIIIIFDSDSDYKSLSEEVYNLSFNIVSDVDINFSFIKSHNPVIFYKTKPIKANIEESISITLSLVNKTSVIFIFDNYNNFANIVFKNICFITTTA
jgi:hypothetical protein